MKKNTIRKHNNVIEACYDMSVPELRLIYSCISKIGFKQTICKEEPFYISAMEYAEAFGVNQKNVHREIRKAVKSIWDRDLIIKRENQKDLRCRWISAEAEYKNGGAEIHFSSQVIPYLVNLQEKGNFTIYQLENIGGLKTAYGIRLYELLVQYKKIGVREIQILELREILCLGDKYKTMCNLKARVIEPAIEEINAYTDLKITYKNNKKGRSITSLKFTITPKPKLKTPNNDKKHLSESDILKMVQTSKFSGKSWPEVYALLDKEGYNFTRKHRF